MVFFWVMIGATFLLAGTFLGWVFVLAREVPDESEKHSRTRLNPDQIRLLSWVLVAVIILFATMHELRLMYGL